MGSVARPEHLSRILGSDNSGDAYPMQEHFERITKRVAARGRLPHSSILDEVTNFLR
jgi:hypothetical protein